MSQAASLSEIHKAEMILRSETRERVGDPPSLATSIASPHRASCFSTPHSKPSMTKGHGKENQHKDAKPSHDKPAYDKVTHDKDAGPREEQKPVCEYPASLGSRAQLIYVSSQRPISPVEMVSTSEACSPFEPEVCAQFALHYFKALEGSDDEPETDLSKFYVGVSRIRVKASPSPPVRTAEGQFHFGDCRRGEAIRGREGHRGDPSRAVCAASDPDITLSFF